MIDIVAAEYHKALRDIQFKEDMDFLKHLWKYDVVERIRSGRPEDNDIYSMYVFILKYGWRVDDWSSG